VIAYNLPFSVTRKSTSSPRYSGILQQLIVINLLFRLPIAISPIVTMHCNEKKQINQGEYWEKHKTRENQTAIKQRCLWLGAGRGGA
jgi:hypothetical protein